MAQFLRLTMERIHQPMLDTDAVTEAELQSTYADLQDPDFWDMSFAMVSAWGRRQP